MMENLLERCTQKGSGNRNEEKKRRKRQIGKSKVEASTLFLHNMNNSLLGWT
jgi:hypothetical protein